MIRYRLACVGGHAFEAWFSSSADFDRQQARGLVECPACGAREIEKQMMAPSVATSRSRERRTEAAAGATPGAGAGRALAALSGEQREMLAKMRELKKALIESSEDVGERFPEEARRIHYGEKKARGIHGKATLADAAELAEEGIEVMPLPDLPQDGN
jgi:hypothetical protein